MRKNWLESYPPGIRPEIDLREFGSVNELLLRSCRNFPDHPAFRSLDTVVTYAQLDRMSRDCAAGLQRLQGLATKSRVAVMMPNLLQYPVALMGILRAGMTAVNVNPLYTVRELEHQLRDSESEAIIILENFAGTLEKALAGTLPIRHVIVTTLGDLIPAPRRWVVNHVVRHVKKVVPPWHIPGAISFRSMLRSGAAGKLDEAEPTHDDIAFLQYTGGTTGRSKAAVLSHRNITANVLQAAAWAEQALMPGREVAITALPLYHIFSLTVSGLLMMKLAALQVLIPNPRDLRSLIAEMNKVPFTVLTGVNTLFNGLLNTPGFGELNFRHLKFAIGGGAAVHPSVASRWESVTGRPLIEGYGLTEASPLVACNPLNSTYSGMIGLPMPSTEVEIRDDQDRALPPCHEGEICVRGPQVTRQYWRHEEDTSQTIAPGGWLRTGDIGVMDEHGYLRLTDRKKDMILVSGFNVYPNEVEGVLAAMPGVSDCAVIGVPNEITGEVVKAFVVAEPGVDEEAVIRYCRQHLTNYKVPKRVEFRTELPKNPIGKVLRRELRIGETTLIKAAGAAAPSASQPS